MTPQELESIREQFDQEPRHLLTAVNEALEMDPTNYDLLEIKADALRRLNQPTERLAVLRKIIAAHPHRTHARLEAAILSLALDRRDEAIADAIIASEASDTDLAVLLAAANVLLKLGQFDNALELYERYWSLVESIQLDSVGDLRDNDFEHATAPLGDAIQYCIETVKKLGTDPAAADWLRAARQILELVEAGPASSGPLHLGPYPTLCSCSRICFEGPDETGGVSQELAELEARLP